MMAWVFVPQSRRAGAAGKNCFLDAMCKDGGELEKWNHTTA
jgi:hypothetical protein